MISLENVTVRDPSRVLIDSLDLDIHKGEIVSLMGPSGSGKSTLLALIAGFLSPHFTATGSISLNDRNILALPAEKRRAGILFQDDLLLPHLSVAQNLAFGLPVMKKQARRERVEAALEAADMPGFGDRRPTTLSGGQRARIALLRTLLSEPEVLLLDEPFSKLDADLRQHFRQFVYEEARARDLPTLMVTHDREDALAMNGPVLAIDDKGRVTAVPAP